MNAVPPPRFTTLLLDLDGTLLDVEMDAFLTAYFPLAAACFGVPDRTGAISGAMLAAARAMMDARDGARTLDQVFLEAFAPAVGLAPSSVREMFAAFHREKFEGLRRFVRPVPGAPVFARQALARGHELVLATNPVFFLDPIRARMRWADLADLPFALVTGAENMRWAKPHEGYYLQILEATGRRPEQCLMVGDNPRMDMAAGQVGITTWLAVPEGAAPREAPLADRRGTLAEMTGWL